MNMNVLFLEKDNEQKLEVPDQQEISKQQEETCNEKEEITNDSLFSNLTTSNETYVTYLVHIVNDEETVDNIMDKNKVSRTELEEYNNLNDIKKGTKLIIPHSND